MNKIENIKELISNLEKVESYLNYDEGSEMREEMIKLIERGKNFVVYIANNEYHFAPSRFVGYASNNIAEHLESNSKHGTRTSNRLRRKSLLGEDVENDKFLQLYIEYCKQLNKDSTTKAFPNKPQTFWDLTNCIIEPTLDMSLGFPEGRTIEEIHRRRERNRSLVKKAKAEFLKNNKCICQVCSFDFEVVYGEPGRNYIEAHHIIPVSELSEGDVTRMSDIVFVCSNCHSMLHRKRPWLSLTELDKLIRSYSS